MKISKFFSKISVSLPVKVIKSTGTPHILSHVGKSKKTARDIYKRTVDIEFERDRLIGLGSTIGDGQTDRHKHTHRHFF